MPRNEYHDTPVVEFHEAFSVPITWTPTTPPEARRRLRLNLILEELLELAAASGFEFVVNGDVGFFEKIGEKRFGFAPSGNTDFVEAADALADLRYVVEGAALEWGIPLEKCLREVHRSNMSKLGADGRPILREDGKVLKGPDFTSPDLRTILELHGGLVR